MGRILFFLCRQLLAVARRSEEARPKHLGRWGAGARRLHSDYTRGRRLRLVNTGAASPL